jgi:hypothetical protein
MRTDPQSKEVRRIVERVFQRYLSQRARRRRDVAIDGNRLQNGCFSRVFPGPDESLDENNLEIRETILVDEGRYVARSYRLNGLLAMWLVAVGILQFYDSRGHMLATINLFESLRPQRMAA